MSQTAIFLWLLNIVVDTVGHMAFKRAAIIEHESEWHRWQQMLRSFPLWLGIFCFVLEFLLWLALLSILPLSLGVLLAAFNMVSIMLAGRWLFGETLDPLRLAGISFIFAGVVLAGGYS